MSQYVSDEVSFVSPKRSVNFSMSHNPSQIIIIKTQRNFFKYLQHFKLEMTQYYNFMVIIVHVHVFVFRFIVWYVCAFAEISWWSVW
jgi:hypothetical protein